MIRTGTVPMPPAYLYRPEAGRLAGLPALLRPPEHVVAPCLAFLLEHPAEGPVLVDTGFHPDASNAIRGFGLVTGVVFRGLRPAEEPFDAQLRRLGVEPGDVRRVVMTHLHGDHTSGMRLLGAARFVCARREWQAANARGASTRGYVGGHLPPAERMDLVDPAEPFGPFSHTLDLLGDGSVRLLSTPGHTAGHLSVLVATEPRPTLIVADAVYTLRALDEELLPYLTHDDQRYLASLRAIKAYAAEHPGTILVPTHDPDAWRAARTGTEPFISSQSADAD